MCGFVNVKFQLFELKDWNLEDLIMGIQIREDKSEEMTKRIHTVKQMTKENDTYFLMCERKWIFRILIIVAGFFGAYTYLL